MIGRKDRLGSRQGNLDPRLGKSVPSIIHLDVMLTGQMFDIEHGLLHDLECSVGPDGAKKD